MKFIRWCGIFVIGHPVIDSQHQELFDIINDFQKELAEGTSANLSMDILTQLIQFAQKHFSDEENISKKFGFPEEDLTHHKKIHEELITDIFQLHQDITSGNTTQLDSISDFLTNWIVLHILVEDYKYKRYFKH